jgi:hypothetical protein
LLDTFQLFDVVAIMECYTSETYPSFRLAGVNDDYDNECGSEECHMELVTVPSVTGVVLRSQRKNSTVVYLD